MREPHPKRLAQGLFVVISLYGCSPSGVGVPDVTFFRAAVDGAVEEEYSGPGYFSWGTRHWGGHTAQVFSRDESGSPRQTFLVRTHDSYRFPVGTHQIGPVQPRDERAEGIEAQYWIEGEAFELFASESGELVITRSTDEVVEGSFTFTGFRYCVRDPETLEDIACRAPDDPAPGSPRVTITGSFVAVPRSGVVEH